MATYRHQLMTIRAAAQKYGIDPAVLWGVYGQESNFGRNPSTSGAGAKGPFQFTDPTARAYGVNPYNFTSSAFGAAKYLSQYKSRGTRGMLAAYNAGPAGNPNNSETQAYIPRVLNYAKGWAAAARAIGGGGAPAPRRGSSPSAGGTAAQTVITGSTAVTPGGTPKADELAAMQQAGTVGRIPATAPPEPAFGASRFMAKVGGPLALTPPLAGSITPPAGPSLAQQLADVGKQQGPDLGSLTTQTLPGSPGTGGGQAPPRGGPMYRHPIPGASISSHDNGADFETHPGTPLRAVGNGVITTLKGAFTPSGSIVLKLDHPYRGQRYVYYGHLQDGNKEVRPNQRVSAGQIIARSSHRPDGAENMPGHVEIGFALGPNGGIQTGGPYQGDRSRGSSLGQLFAHFLGYLR